MSSHLEVLKATYEGASGDNVTRLLSVLAPNAEWTEAAGFPYAGTYVGSDAIITHVFQRLATEWIDYRAEARQYLEQGDQIAVFGVYSGTYKATGKAMTASFAHLYTFADGKILRMVQYVDSHMVQQALVK
ncbi:nuclear transport factor 2 family protein [Undibacterium sp. Ji67W]|uniref:nuclear transport factor 2 family protein n=1 Tax=Undibacterium sp. Ji67W TaxID=3413042 RepID=UPI003BF181D4